MNTNIYSKPFNHLKKDKVMEQLINKLGGQIDIRDRYFKNHAKAISEIIIEQQISFKAAISIKKKFNSLISGLSDKEVIEIDDIQLKEIGISGMKVNYIKNVYRYFQNNKIDFKKFKDNEVINMLTEIKGVGSWTAEMFLIFILFSEDIL